MYTIRETLFIVGIILRVAPCDMPKGKEIFDDGPWYETPDDFNNDSYVQNGHRMGELLQKGEAETKE